MSGGKFFGFIIGAALGGPIGAGIGTYLGSLSDDQDEKNSIGKAKFLRGNWVRVENKLIIVECPHCLSLAKQNSCGELWECNKCKKPFEFNIDQDDINYAQKNETRNHERGTECAFYILGAVAKADGVISEAEIEYTLKIMDECSFSDKTIALAKNAFKQGRDNGVYEGYAETFHSIYWGSNEVILNFVHSLLELALADGKIDVNEEKIIRKICLQIFGINNDYFSKMINEAKIHQNSEYYNEQKRKEDSNNNQKNTTDGLSALQKAYATLGCTAEESLLNIKSKYKKLCVQYHPDKISALNLAPEFEKLATDKIKEINTAYELIMNEIKTKDVKPLISIDKLFEMANAGEDSIIIDNRIDKVRNNNGLTPLHILACSQALSIAEKVLQHPSVDKVKNDRGITPLHFLAATETFSIAERVLLHPSVDKIKDNNGDTPLHYLACRKNSLIVEKVLQHPSMDKVKDKEGETPLFNIENGPHSHLAQQFRNRNKVHNDNVKSSQHQSASIAKDSDGNTPLHCFALIETFSIAEKLFQNPSVDKDRNSKGQTPLHLLAYSSNFLIAEKVLQHPSSDKVQDENGLTPLHYIAKVENISIAEEVLKHPSVDTVKDFVGNTPLFYMESGRNFHLVKLYRNRKKAA